MATADVGITMTFTWNGKKPSEGTVCGDTNADTGGTAILCQAFIKVLDPNNGYAATPGVYADTSGYGKLRWDTSGTLSVDITEAMVGWPIQFGFTNTGGAYHPSAMIYDNMVVAATDTPEPTPAPTPAPTPEPTPAPAPTADDLFVSEYGEGPSGTSSWGKYLEIANFTGADVSLNGYILGGITNGGDAYEKYVSFTADATVANGDVWVIGRAEAGDGSPEALHTQIDQVNTDVTHNGDDAWHLLAGTSDSYTLVDAAIGDAGDDPGSGFTVCGDGTTANVTLIRKAGVDGAADWATSAGTDASSCQWTIVSQSADALDYSDVGKHTFVAEEAASE